jgi:hypothetical protein
VLCPGHIKPGNIARMRKRSFSIAQSKEYAPQC